MGCPWISVPKLEMAADMLFKFDCEQATIHKISQISLLLVFKLQVGFLNESLKWQMN